MSALPRLEYSISGSVIQMWDDDYAKTKDARIAASFRTDLRYGGS